MTSRFQIVDFLPSYPSFTFLFSAVARGLYGVRTLRVQCYALGTLCSTGTSKQWRSDIKTSFFPVASSYGTTLRIGKRFAFALVIIRAHFLANNEFRAYFDHHVHVQRPSQARQC